MRKDELIVLFDDLGDRYEVENVSNMKLMRSELLDDDLEMLYKSTRYFHELELAKQELMDLGFIEQIKGDVYSPAPTLRGISELSDEITTRLGIVVLKTFSDEVDLTWKENKPDLSKYKK